MKNLIFMLLLGLLFTACSQGETDSSSEAILDEIKSYAKEKGVSEEQFGINVLEDRVPSKIEIVAVKMYIDKIAEDNLKNPYIGKKESEKIMEELQQASDSGDEKKYKELLKKYNIKFEENPTLVNE